MIPLIYMKNKRGALPHNFLYCLSSMKHVKSAQRWFRRYTLGNCLEPKSSGDLPPENNFPSDMATSRDDIRPEGKLICRIQKNRSTGERDIKGIYTYWSHTSYTFLKEPDGNVIPIKKPNTIPTIVVIISFAFSFLLGAPLQKIKDLSIFQTKNSFITCKAASKYTSGAWSPSEFVKSPNILQKN